MPEPPSKPAGLPGDYGYGVLNSVGKPKVGLSLDLGASDPWLSIKKATENLYSFDALANTGPYRGVVLRVEENFTNQAKNNPDDATQYIYDEDTTETPPQLVRIKVRVPELHPHLPIPTAWGDVEDVGVQSTIELYPTYIGQSDLVVKPRVGDIVWVDYTNKNDFTDPIYIRPVTEQQYFATQFAGVIGSAAFAACAGTTAGTGGSVGDATPTAGGAGNQNYPKGARKLPADAETIIIESTELPPDPALKPKLEAGLKRVDLKARGWVGRIQSNATRQIAILVPATTNFENPIEIIYWLHGAKSWFSANTPGFILKDMKKFSGQGRNFALVYVQLSWGLGKYAGGKAAGGSDTFNGTTGGNLATLNADCQGLLKKHFSSGGKLEVGFITVACHSKGGQALKYAAGGGQLAEVAPNKITLADADYNAFGGDTTLIVYNDYVKTAGKDVELNLLCISSDRRPDNYPSKGQENVMWQGKKLKKGDNGNQPRKNMEKLMTLLGVQTGTQKITATKENGGGTSYITYSPYMLSHSAIGIRHGLNFSGAGPESPKENKDETEEPPAYGPELPPESPPGGAEGADTNGNIEGALGPEDS